MKSQGFAVFISWIGLLLAIACAFGLFLAGGFAFSLVKETASSGPGAGFAFLVVTSYLAVLGIASVIAGGLAVFLSEQSISTPWHKKRSWIAIVIGAAAVVTGLVFGVSLF